MGSAGVDGTDRRISLQLGLQQRDGRGGVILNIASDLSVFSPNQRLYRKDGVAEEMQPVTPVTNSVIKAGLIGLTQHPGHLLGRKRHLRQRSRRAVFIPVRAKRSCADCRQ